MSENEKHLFISLRIKNLKIGRFEFKNYRYVTESEEDVEELKALVATMPRQTQVNVNYLGLQAEAAVKKSELNRELNAGRSVGAIPAPGLQASETDGPKVSRGPLSSGPVSPAAAVTGTKVDLGSDAMKKLVSQANVQIPGKS